MHRRSCLWCVGLVAKVMPMVPWFGCQGHLYRAWVWLSRSFVSCVDLVDKSFLSCVSLVAKVISIVRGLIDSHYSFT
jgi:hypothetical protein